MMIDYKKKFPNLFGKWTSAGKLTANLAAVKSCVHTEYEELKKCAPSRPLHMPYFVDAHNGNTAAKKSNTLREKPLAIALWKLDKKWPRGDNGWFRLIDYETPLQSVMKDAVGDIDLFGVTDQGRMMIIELKIKSKGKSNSNSTPLTALMQGLRYAAIVEANHDRIIKDAGKKKDRPATIRNQTPLVQILAPLDWWCGWFKPSTKNGDWKREFSLLTGELENKLGISIECMALENPNPLVNRNRRQPTLKRAPKLYPVRPAETPPIDKKSGITKCGLSLVLTERC